MTRRNVTDFTNSDDGPVLRWRCHCGHEGTLGRHGSVADGAPATRPVLPTAVPAHTHC